MIVVAGSAKSKVGVSYTPAGTTLDTTKAREFGYGVSLDAGNMTPRGQGSPSFGITESQSGVYFVAPSNSFRHYVEGVVATADPTWTTVRGHMLWVGGRWDGTNFTDALGIYHHGGGQCRFQLFKNTNSLYGPSFITGANEVAATAPVVGDVLRLEMTISGSDWVFQYKKNGSLVTSLTVPGMSTSGVKPTLGYEVGKFGGVGGRVPASGWQNYYPGAFKGPLKFGDL